MREYFSFKKLNKRRKIWFIIYLICSSIQISVGILNKELIFVFFGIFAFFVGLDLFHDQASETLIKEYADMVEKQEKDYRITLATISDAIKTKDMDYLEKMSKTIDEYYYGKVNKNDSN